VSADERQAVNLAGADGLRFSPDLAQARQTLTIIILVYPAPNPKFPRSVIICPTGSPATSAALPRDASPFLYFSTASRILPRVTRSRTAFDRSLRSSRLIALRNS
jgi:hypothetical protein